MEFDVEIEAFLSVQCLHSMLCIPSSIVVSIGFNRSKPENYLILKELFVFFFSLRVIVLKRETCHYVNVVHTIAEAMC